MTSSGGKPARKASQFLAAAVSGAWGHRAAAVPRERRGQSGAPCSGEVALYSLRVAIGGIGPLVSIPCTSATVSMNH
jgi:hypothetical protein